MGAIYGVLCLSAYKFDFGTVWKYRGQYLRGFGTTFVAALLAYALGLALGVIVALARLSRTLWIRHLGDLYVEVVRGLPVLAIILIAYWGFAPVFHVDDRFVVGVTALGVFVAAYIGEIFRAGIQSIERGQFEAARSLGLTRQQTLRHVVLPQAFKRMIPPLTNEFIAVTKETSLLWAVGVAELIAAAKQTGADSYKYIEAFMVAAVLYLCITITLSMLARHLERRLSRSERSGLDL